MVISVFTLTALSFGTMGSISVFLKPLSNEFGWTRANTAFGYTVASLGSAFLELSGDMSLINMEQDFLAFLLLFLWSPAYFFSVNRIVYFIFTYYIFVLAHLEMQW